MAERECDCGGLHQITIDCDLADELRTLLPRLTVALERFEHPPAMKLGLSHPEAAEQLGISVAMLAGLIKAGEIKPTRFGTRSIIPLTEVQRVLQPGATVLRQVV